MDSNLAIKSDLAFQNPENTHLKKPLHPALIANMGKGRPKGAKNKSTILAIKEIKEAQLFARDITPEDVKRYKRMVEFKQLVKVNEKLDCSTLEPVDEIKLRLDYARVVKTDPQEINTTSMSITVSSSDIIKMREMANRGK